MKHNTTIISPQTINKLRAQNPSVLARNSNIPAKSKMAMKSHPHLGPVLRLSMDPEDRNSNFPQSRRR
jgi:hypothetical protein